MKIGDFTSWIAAFFIFFSGNALKSQVIYDVFAEKELNCEPASENITPEYLEVSGGIPVTYFQITSPENAAQKSVNEALLPLCRKFTDNESDYLRLLIELKPRLAVFEELQGSGNNYYGRQTSASTVMADLNSITCEPVSLVDGRLFFSVRYDFKIPDSYVREEEYPSLHHYYIANLKNGTVTRHKNACSPSAAEKVMALINTRLNAQYHLRKSEVSLKPLEPLSPNKAVYAGLDFSAYGNIGTQTDLTEADFVWTGFGLTVRFPEYSESSKIYDGRPFELFLPFDEAKEAARLLSGFEFVSNLKPKASTYSGFTFLNPLGTFETMSKPPNADLLFEQFQDRIPDNLTIETYQFLNNGERSLYSAQTLLFDSLGRVAESTTENKSGKLRQRVAYTRDGEGRLTLKYMEERRESAERFGYDNSGNLTVHERINGYESGVTYAFYTGRYAYLYRTENNDFQKFEKRDNELCYRNICYVLNERDQVIGVSNSPAMMGYAQVGYDRNNKLTEIHRATEDEHTYVIYDDRGRLQSRSSQRGVEKGQESLFYYEDDSSLPFESTHSGIGFMNKYLEVYTWEY